MTTLQFHSACHGAVQRVTFTDMPMQKAYLFVVVGERTAESIGKLIFILPFARCIQTDVNDGLSYHSGVEGTESFHSRGMVHSHTGISSQHRTGGRSISMLEPSTRQESTVMISSVTFTHHARARRNHPRNISLKSVTICKPLIQSCALMVVSLVEIYQRSLVLSHTVTSKSVSRYYLERNKARKRKISRKKQNMRD